MVALMNRFDSDRLGLAESDIFGMRTICDDGINRWLDGLRVTPYDIPASCIGAYYPKADVPLPLQHFAGGSKTPAAKSIPVQVTRDGVAVMSVLH